MTVTQNDFKNARPGARKLVGTAPADEGPGVPFLAKIFAVLYPSRTFTAW